MTAVEWSATVTAAATVVLAMLAGIQAAFLRLSQKAYRLMSRPIVFAYLRDATDQPGIRVHNGGRGAAWNGRITITSFPSKATSAYEFTVIYERTEYRYPNPGQQLLQFDRNSDTKIHVAISYSDEEKGGTEYRWEGDFELQKAWISGGDGTPDSPNTIDGSSSPPSRADAPSLDLAFEWQKGILRDQAQASEALDSKAVAFFSVATVVLGLAATFGFKTPSAAGTVATLFGGLGFMAYAVAMGGAISALSLRRFETLDNPVMMREWYWDMAPSQFKMELLTHLEDAYSKNNEQLRSKAGKVKIATYAVALEVGFVVLAIWFAL